MASPAGYRTRVTNVKGWCPRPLDDGDRVINGIFRDISVFAVSFNFHHLNPHVVAVKGRVLHLYATDFQEDYNLA